jgi:hypothetical protein
MKVIKYFILAVSILCISNLLLAQSIVYGTDDNSKVNDEKSQSENQTFSNSEKSKLSYHVEIGSMISTSKYFGNAFTFYTLPSLRYKLSPKLNITAGLMLINTNNNSYYVSDNHSNRNYSAYVMTGFDYTKERLRVSGEILYGMNRTTYNLNNGKNSPEYFARFGAEYKITNNLNVGFQIINHNMNQSYYNPFGYQFYNPYQRFNPYSEF